MTQKVGPVCTLISQKKNFVNLNFNSNLAANRKSCEREREEEKIIQKINTERENPM